MTSSYRRPNSIDQASGERQTYVDADTIVRFKLEWSFLGKELGKDEGSTGLGLPWAVYPPERKWVLAPGAVRR
jgi:hypothetical protein